MWALKPLRSTKTPPSVISNTQAEPVALCLLPAPRSPVGIGEMRLILRLDGRPPLKTEHASEPTPSARSLTFQSPTHTPRPGLRLPCKPKPATPLNRSWSRASGDGYVRSTWLIAQTPWRKAHPAEPAGIGSVLSPHFLQPRRRAQHVRITTRAADS